MFKLNELFSPKTEFIASFFYENRRHGKSMQA